jgi:hypothetical protein
MKHLFLIFNWTAKVFFLKKNLFRHVKHVSIERKKIFFFLKKMLGLGGKRAQMTCEACLH